MGTYTNQLKLNIGSTGRAATPPVTEQVIGPPTQFVYRITIIPFRPWQIKNNQKSYETMKQRLFRHRVEGNPARCFVLQPDSSKEERTMERKFITADEVSELLGVAKPTAYKLIRKMNDELNAQGYITVAGRVSRKFFEEKTYMVGEE